MQEHFHSHHKRMKYIGFFAIVLAAIPLAANAQWSSWRGGNIDWGDRMSSYEDELDDDPVESFSIPVLFGVTLENVVPDFGASRDGGSREHEGQDFLAPEGAPVVSPTDAVVLSVGKGESAGKYVYTLNPGGEQFRYMHLSEVADLDRGDVLQAGDYIGQVGDTGNAPDGVYHLHFETRGEDGAEDPYPRLTGTFTLKEKASFLDDIFRDLDDEDEYADFLVTTFRNDMERAFKAGYALPDEVVEALEERGVVAAAKQAAALAEIIEQLPTYLAMELEQGDQGVAVMLLQLYIIYTSEGVGHDALAAAGMTGYYGPVTAAAVAELQALHGIGVSGRYDAATRQQLLP